MVIKLAIYGIAGAAIMAGIALMRRVRFEHGRLRPGIPGLVDAQRRLRRITILAWIALVCGVGLLTLLMLGVGY